MKKAVKIFSFVLILMTFFSPVAVLAQGQVAVDSGNQGLVPCGSEVDSSGKIKNPCTFAHFVIMVNKVVTFLLKALVLPICAIMFAYAGFLLITSGGEASQRNKAKKIFMNVLLGLVIALVAWLVVNLILDLLGYDGSWIGF